MFQLFRVSSDQHSEPIVLNNIYFSEARLQILYRIGTNTGINNNRWTVPPKYSPRPIFLEVVEHRTKALHRSDELGAVVLVPDRQMMNQLDHLLLRDTCPP